MKKLSTQMTTVAIILLAGLTSFSAQDVYEAPHQSGQILTDTTLQALSSFSVIAEEPVDPVLENTYTVCTSEECFLATLPEVLPGETILPGVAYTVCSTEECFLAILSETVDNNGVPLFVMENAKPQ